MHTGPVGRLGIVFGRVYVQSGGRLRRAHVFGAKAPTARRSPLQRPATLAAAVSMAAVVVAGCGSSHRPAAAAAGPDTIVIRNFAFQPSTLVVAPGAKVTVRNADPAIHTVTVSGSSKPFDTGNIQPGATATFTAPSAAGSYSYICQIHQFMHGTLQVR